MTQKQTYSALYLLLSGIIPFITYLLTAPTDLTLGIFGADSGELITASQTGGIAHPHGYPTWLITSRTFATLPIGRTLAHRYNMFSAVNMSLAMTCLFQACQLKLKGKKSITSLAAVLAIAFTLTIWSQAVITEVYALNALVVSLIILLLVKVNISADSASLVGLLGLVCGIAATTHLTSILLLPAVGLTLLIRIRSKWVKTFSICAVTFAIGLTPFLLLFWRAGNNSPVIWGDASTFEGWWWMISGVIYRPNVFAVSIANILGRIQTVFFADLLKLIPLLIPLGAIIGVGLQIFNSRTKTNEQKTSFDWVLPLLLLLTTALYTVYALSYNTQDWRIFLIPAVLCLTLPLAMGLSEFDAWSLGLPLLLVAVNLPILLNGRSDTTRGQAEMVFSQVPANAILLTDGRDETVFPIWYFRYAENQRPDTLVVDQNLFAFDWYRARLATQNPTLQAVAVDDLIQFRQQNSQTRPICEISLHPFALSCTDR